MKKGRGGGRPSGGGFESRRGGGEGSGFGGKRGGRDAGGFGAKRGGRDAGGFGTKRGGRDGSGFGAKRGGRDAGGFESRRGGRDAGGFESKRGGRDAGSFESRRGARDERPRREDSRREFDRPRREEAKPQSFERPRREAQPSGEGNPRFIYGVNPVLEAVRAKPERIEHLYIAEGHVQPSVAGELLSRARDAGIRTERVQRERLNALAEGGVHQGVVAEVRLFDYAELPDLIDRAKASGDPPLIVVLDGIQDPHNLGAIIRSAHALGAHGVVIAKDRAAQVTGIVAKSSAGAIEHCPIARVINIARALEELKEAGLWTAAADPEGDVLLPDAKLDGPLAVVIGAEGEGVREGVLKASDFRVKIPMGGQVGSLNASVSAGILLYEVVRQRRAPRA